MKDEKKNFFDVGELTDEFMSTWRETLESGRMTPMSRLEFIKQKIELGKLQQLSVISARLKDQK